MNRLDVYGYAGLYKALKHKYKYALSTNLPCVSRHSQFLALLCIFPELISLQETCGSRFRLISRLFGCLKCLLSLPEMNPSLVVEATVPPTLSPRISNGALRRWLGDNISYFCKKIWQLPQPTKGGHF